jgi:hypothetical protein
MQQGAQSQSSLRGKLVCGETKDRRAKENQMWYAAIPRSADHTFK